MGQQYLRDLLLTTPAGEFSQLKIEFDVEKTVSGVPNKATIKIWNLTKSSRNTLKKELDEIKLESGYVYAGNRGLIFKGFTRDVTHERKGTDIITTLKCGDGDKSQRKSHVAKTYNTKTPVKDIILDIQKQMKGVTLGEIKLPEKVTPSDRAMTFITTPQRALNELGRTYGFYWSIQNGSLEIIPADGALSGVVYITPETGMIGVPTITDSGVIVQALLNPDVRPGRQIYVKSETTDEAGQSGLYRVSSVAFSGDNRDGDHIIEVEAELLKNGKTTVK